MMDELEEATRTYTHAAAARDAEHVQRLHVDAYMQDTTEEE
jgi:hypothetical protein